MQNFIIKYWEKIESGEIIVCKRIRQLYEKIVDELNNPKNPYIFDIKKATKPIEFIEKFCRHSKGKWFGKPIVLELWQKAMIQIVFGFVNADTGYRKYKEWILFVGRKNGKSTLAAGIGLYEMIAENGSDVVCVATTSKQAEIVFTEAFNMVKQSPVLSKQIKKRKTDLFYENKFSTFMPLSSKSDSQNGHNAQLGIVDEIHAIKGRDIYDVVRQSQSSRDQPLMLGISTNGFCRESLYDNLYNYAVNVLDGITPDESFISFIYELDSESEWDNPECWVKANPALKTIKNYDDMVANCEKSKSDATFKPTFLTKDLNIISTINGSWLEFSVLNNTDTFDISEFKGSYGIGGVDLSQVGDLTCATLLLMKKNNPIKYVVQNYFIPSEIAFQKEKQDKIPYSIFANQGQLTFSGTNKIDYSDVTNWYKMIINEYGIIPYWIGYDDWNSEYWVQEMKNNRFNMVVVRQGYKSVSPVMKEMEADFREKKINYNNNNLLKWCLSNTQIVTDPAGNIKFDKSKNKNMRIDGMASFYCAYKVLLDNYTKYQTLIK